MPLKRSPKGFGTPSDALKTLFQKAPYAKTTVVVFIFHDGGFMISRTWFLHFTYVVDG